MALPDDQILLILTRVRAYLRDDEIRSVIALLRTTQAYRENESFRVRVDRMEAQM